METICNDLVFGKMSYRHRWYKKQEIFMFGVKWNVTVVAKAFSGKEINEAQRNAYRKFLNEEKEIVETLEQEIKKYINNNLDDICLYCKSASKLQSIAEIKEIVIPKTLLFDKDGIPVFVFDFLWDKENGIAAKLEPTIEIGRQELFL